MWQAMSGLSTIVDSLRVVEGLIVSVNQVSVNTNQTITRSVFELPCWSNNQLKCQKWCYTKMKLWRYPTLVSYY